MNIKIILKCIGNIHAHADIPRYEKLDCFSYFTFQQISNTLSDLVMFCLFSRWDPKCLTFLSFSYLEFEHLSNSTRVQFQVTGQSIGLVSAGVKSHNVTDIFTIVDTVKKQ